MSAFVGTKTVDSSEELRSLIQQLKSENSWFFLKWPHKVSGFCKMLPSDFPSPQGQMFDNQKELRWKQQGKAYSVLLLSTEGNYLDFEPVGKEWSVQVQEAHLYPPTETRFPRGIDNPKVNVSQCYFSDSKTATVHFVALKVS